MMLRSIMEEVSLFFFEECPDQWVGHGGPIALPPQPRISPITLFQWGHVTTHT